MDGYNLLHSLKEYREEDFQILRDKVVDMVCDFGGYVNAQCVLVFDAYKTEEKRTRTINHDNITIVYTKNKQTADEYIEVKTKELTKDYKVIVVTSDYLEQLRIFANGANRMRTFLMKINTVVQFDEKDVNITDLDAEIKAVLKDNKITLKSVEGVDVYVKPEAKYLVVKVNGETKEYVLK